VGVGHLMFERMMTSMELPVLRCKSCPLQKAEWSFILVPVTPVYLPPDDRLLWMPLSCSNVCTLYM
jgi:hypothetical protein